MLVGMANNHKVLTHDERKAAEAAFTGRSFNEEWSASARAIYEGLVKFLPQTVVTTSSLSTAEKSMDTLLAQEQIAQQDLTDESILPPAIRNREAAIQAGTLIDVTSTALELGITFPVTITRPLWEMGVVTNQTLPENDQTSRLRDILMAFRLRLTSLTTISPLLDFPVLLALPPSKVPQPVPLFALIQPDPTHQANVTLLLPAEVSLSIITLN